MDPSLMALTVGLVSFAGGFACASLLGRRRAGGPAAADPAATAAEAAPADVAGSGLLLELHLVMNVLNRVVMALNANEHVQDGVAEMADYLRASHELQRRPGQNALVNQVSSYWRLSRWLHGRRSDALHLDAQVPDLAPQALYRLCEALTRVLRELEGSPSADVSIRITPDDRAGAGRFAVAQVTVAGVPEGVQATLAASPRGWSRSALQLGTRLEVRTDG